MKKAFKMVGYVLLFLVAFVAIYILTNDVHTDLVLPKKDSLIDWGRHIKFENTFDKSHSCARRDGLGRQGFLLRNADWSRFEIQHGVQSRVQSEHFGDSHDVLPNHVGSCKL